MIKIKRNGIFSALLSAIIFGTMPLFTKLIYSFGANEVSAAFYRVFLSLFLIYISGKKRKHSFSLSFKEIKYLSIASLSFTLTSLTLFKAYNYMDSGAVTSIHFAYPIIIFIMNSIKSNNVPNPKEIVSIIVCTVALIFLYNPSSLNSHGIILAFISALTYSIYSYMLDSESIRSLDTSSKLLYINLLSAFGIILFSLVTKQEIKLDLNLVEWSGAFAYSAILTLGATSLYQKAISSIGAKETSILSTFEPITSVILGVFLLGEKVSFIQVIAIALILSSATYLVNQNNKVLSKTRY